MSWIVPLVGISRVLSLSRDAMDAFVASRFWTLQAITCKSTGHRGGLGSSASALRSVPLEADLSCKTSIIA